MSPSLAAESRQGYPQITQISADSFSEICVHRDHRVSADENTHGGSAGAGVASANQPGDFECPPVHWRALTRLPPQPHPSG
jgi:hypothetical protein